MASQALSAETNKRAFVDACALADVDAAAARHRGLEVNVEGVSLSFYRARDGTVTCVETACPHAGHRLCDGYAADPGDIEDLLTGTGVLATIGATAPFVGLFGTVWGIKNAFIGISEAHTTNLAVVAPGIAEALLATALGLVAAIPAVVIYNHLTRSIAGYRALLGDASVMVMLLVSREGDRSLFRLARAAE